MTHGLKPNPAYNDYGARKPADLPAAARHYLDRISALTGLKISLASVGPEREQLVAF